MKFAIVDCNNFFVSCERIFQPKLNNVPVIVLSNNDGCAVARSNEAKKIGIAMGEPFFKIRNLIKKHKVQVFSSNFSLYNDISNRIMDILFDLAPDVTVYSIDEAFLDLTSLTKNYDLVKFCQNIVDTIARYTNIPVSIGIGSSRTLAKVANHYCKRNVVKGGVFDISCSKKQLQVFKNFNIGDVWGIGRQWKKKLNSLGVFNLLQLIKLPEQLIKEKFNIVLYRTIQELKGISCIDLEETEHNKQILVSRSFGERVEDIKSLKEAVAYHTSNACKKLRRQNLASKNITVFIHTNMLSEYELKYRGSFSIELDAYTCDTRKLIKAAITAVEKIYKSGYRYKKAGIMLSNLVLMENLQLDMFANEKEEVSVALMQAIDRVNDRMGKSTLFFGACGIKKDLKNDLKQDWRMKSNMSSLINLSNWDKLPVVKA